MAYLYDVGSNFEVLTQKYKEVSIDGTNVDVDASIADNVDADVVIGVDSHVAGNADADVDVDANTHVEEYPALQKDRVCLSKKDRPTMGSWRSHEGNADLLLQMR